MVPLNHIKIIKATPSSKRDAVFREYWYDGNIRCISVISLLKRSDILTLLANLVGKSLLCDACRKENIPTEQNGEPVQYTFNISKNDQFGFDSDASTKGGPEKAYKTAWASGDRIFLFFKPTAVSLLDDRYATLTYNGSSWNGGVSDTSNLGEAGTLSAVYVYKLDSNDEPIFTGSRWKIETGNVFYNCQAGVSYTVSGTNEISASLNLEVPTPGRRLRESFRGCSQSQTASWYVSPKATCGTVRKQRVQQQPSTSRPTSIPFPLHGMQVTFPITSGARMLP